MRAISPVDRKFEVSSASASTLLPDESNSFDLLEPKVHVQATRGFVDFCVAAALAGWVGAVVWAAGVIPW